MSIPEVSSETAEIYQSSCLCGANIISYSGPPILKFKCHCLDERKLTGAAFALNILFPSTSLTTIRGKLTTYTKTADSGNQITNHACGTCGGLLYRSSTGYPGTVVVKAGCNGNDYAETYVPDVEIYTRSRLAWVQPIEGAKQEIAGFTE